MSRLERLLQEERNQCMVEKDDETFIFKMNNYFCGSCLVPTKIETTIGIPICHVCGWINTGFVDNNPEWKQIKQQEESAKPTTSSSSTSTFNNTITTVALSNYIEKNGKLSSNVAALTTSTSSLSVYRPPRRKKVRFSTDVHSMTEREPAFKPSINDRTFYDHCQHMAQICAEYRMHRVIYERSIWWYKELLQFYKFHGFVCDSLKAACIYMASNEYKFPVTQKHCADMFGVTKTYTTKCINLLEKHRNSILNDVPGNNNCILYLPESVQKSRQLQFASLKVPKHTQDCCKPAEYIRLFLSKMNPSEVNGSSPHVLTMEQIMLCFFVAKKVEEHQLASDNYPHCVAAAILFMVACCTSSSSLKGEQFSKKRICEISQTSEVTLNRCYNKLYSYKHDLFPPSALFGSSSVL